MSRFSISKSVNNFAQCSQTRVDLFSLIQGFTFCSSFTYFLTSGQINKIQSSSFSTEIFQIILTDGNYEEHMRSWWSLIHHCGCNSSLISCFFYQLINFFRGRNIILSQIFNENSSLFIRSDLQVWLVRINQISEFLHVQLNEWNFDSKLYVFSAWIDSIEYMSYHTWNYTWLCSNQLSYLTFHSMGFSWRCLTICKYGSIETLNYTVHNRCCCVIINIWLLGIRIENFIKWKFQTIFQIFNISGFNGNCFLIKQLMCMRSSQGFLSLIDGSESTYDFNIGCCCYFLWTWHLSIEEN